MLKMTVTVHLENEAEPYAEFTYGGGGWFDQNGQLLDTSWVAHQYLTALDALHNAVQSEIRNWQLGG